MKHKILLAVTVGLLMLGASAAAPANVPVVQAATTGQCTAYANAMDGYLYGTDPSSFVAAFQTSDGGSTTATTINVRTDNRSPKEIYRGYFAFTNCLPAPGPGQWIEINSITFYWYAWYSNTWNYPYSPALISFWNHYWISPLDGGSQETNWDTLGAMRLQNQYLGDKEVTYGAGWRNTSLTPGDWAFEPVIKFGAKMAQTDQPTEWGQQFYAMQMIYSGNHSSLKPYLVINYTIYP